MFLRPLTQLQKETLLCLAHNVVVSDGELTTGEQLMMEEMRLEMELPNNFEPRYLPLEGIEKVFESKRDRAIVLVSLVRLGYADGAFEIEEQCFLSDLCRAFETTDAEFDLIQNWVRRLVALEREARGFM